MQQTFMTTKLSSLHTNPIFCPLPSLINYKGLESLPPFQKERRTLTERERDYIRKLSTELLKKDPTLTIQRVHLYFGVNRVTYKNTMGDLINLFQHSQAKYSVLKKVQDFKPMRWNKALNRADRVFAARGLSPNHCMICNMTEHQGHSFREVMELDHLNKNRKDHRLENLRVICATCHSMCSTTGSDQPLLDLDVTTADVKTVNVYSSVEQIEANPSKKRRLDAQSGRGLKPYVSRNVHDLFRVYQSNEPEKKTALLGDRLIAEGIKKPMCERCGVQSWNGLPLDTFFHVHHKDKNRLNNTVENLEIVCPNCHKLEHKQGIPPKEEFHSCPYDLNAPDVVKVKNALCSELKRRNMKELAKELGLSFCRLERIGKACFKHYWFPMTEKRSVRDFDTNAGREAIQYSLDALYAHDFQYDATREWLRKSTDKYVPEPLFVFIYNHFKHDWKAGRFITDPALVTLQTVERSSEAGSKIIPRPRFKRVEV
jgi:5-methylcytosine-specific restriction endonuclease McrA